MFEFVRPVVLTSMSFTIIPCEAFGKLEQFEPPHFNQHPQHAPEGSSIWPMKDTYYSIPFAAPGGGTVHNVHVTDHLAARDSIVATVTRP